MAAGAGFKTFATGDVLTAADTNGYLMQGVWVFASAAARDAAVTSPQEGNTCYLKDTDQILVYSGSAWVVKSGGSPLTTKGDLYTYSTTDARLAVGTNGQVLQADSTAATGLKWATAAAGSLTKISSTTMSNVASQDFLSVFSGTYRAYIVEFSQLWTGNASTTTLQASFYSGTNTAYTDGIRGGFLQITNAGASATGYGMSAGAVASMSEIPPEGNRFAGGTWNISNAGQNSGGFGGLNITGQFIGGGDNMRNWVGAFKSTNNTAITGFKLYCAAGNINGIVNIYGLEN